MTEHIIASIKPPPHLHNFAYPNPRPIPASSSPYYKLLDLSLYHIKDNTITSDEIHFQFQQPIQNVYKYQNNLILVLETEIIIQKSGRNFLRKEFDTILGTL